MSKKKNKQNVSNAQTPVLEQASDAEEQAVSAVIPEISSIKAPTLVEEIKENAAEKPVNRIRIAVVAKNFSHISNYSPAQSARCIKSWRANQVIRNQVEIDFLINIEAPIEVYFRDM